MALRILLSGTVTRLGSSCDEGLRSYHCSLSYLFLPSQRQTSIFQKILKRSASITIYHNSNPRKSSEENTARTHHPIFALETLDYCTPDDTHDDLQVDFSTVSRVYSNSFAFLLLNDAGEGVQLLFLLCFLIEFALSGWFASPVKSV